MLALLKRHLKIIKKDATEHPIGMGFLVLFILLFAFIEIWFDFARPPVRDWLAKNLEQIKIPDKNNYSFAVFGDNKNSHLTFPRLLRRVSNDHEIKFAMDLGDLVFDGEMEKYRYFFKQVKRNLRVPLLTAIGNHELRENGRGLYYELLGPFYYSFHIGNDYFIVLDDANEKGLDLWQLNWLKKQLKDSISYKHKFVFMHVPLFDPRNSKIPTPFFHHCLPRKSAEKLLKLFEKYKVTHIFASHIHAYYRGKWGSIPYTITGGAGAELVGDNPSHDFYHYLKVSIKGDKVDIKVVHIPTPDYNWADRIGSLIWIYVYAIVRFHGIQIALLLLIGYLFSIVFKVSQ